MSDKKYKEPDLLWSTETLTKYKNMLNFYNNNFWGYGVFGKLTEYNPATKEGQQAILANMDYAKNNAENFIANLAIPIGIEGTGLFIKWITTPVKIGEGAEAVVTAAPLSPNVTKVTSIPKAEMHIRNNVPGAVLSTFKNTSNGLNTYTLPRVRILPQKAWKAASNEIEKLMKKAGWRKIMHPNLQGLGFTNGKWVVSDLGPGNVGRDWLGRIRFPDFSIESLPLFRLAMLKQGGLLNAKINNN